MSKTFRAWQIDEPLFLPPMMGDFVAEDHLAHFVLSLIRDDLDPMADKPATPQQRQGMSPCCPGMAMMGRSGSMPGMRN